MTMLFDDIKKKIDERVASQTREIEQLIAKLNEIQQHPSVANELMPESLQYRKEKIAREAK